MPLSPPAVLDSLRSFLARQASLNGADSDLLARFAEAGEGDAFAALLGRHGPMVLALARRVVGDGQLAEDVFQAAFLLLARRAHTIRRPESLACWLHGVTFRLALRARRSHHRRQQREHLGHRTPSRTPLEELTAQELVAVLDEEVQRLPEQNRAALILCCLEGLSQDEAARQLGCSADAVRGRLERGRKQLRLRLQKRGLLLPAVLGGSLLITDPAGAVPSALALATLRAVKAGTAPSPAVGLLLKGAVRTILFHKLKLVSATVMLLVITGGGLGMVLRSQGARDAEPPARQTPGQEGKACEQPRRQAEPSVRTDRFGDPLPEGAIARLGTSRFQHGSFLGTVTFSSDGRYIASHSPDGTTRLWDAATGREVAPATHAKEGPLSAGGKLLILDRRAKGICLRDIISDRDAGTLPLDWPDGLFLLSPDARAFVAYRRSFLGGRVENVLVFGDLAGKKAPTRVTLPEGREVARFAFSADGRTLVLSYHNDQKIHIWDPATCSERRAFETLAPNTTGRHWALSPDGRTLATASPVQGTPILLWDLSTGRKMEPLPSHPDRAIDSLTFSPDGRMLASVSIPNLVCLWDLSARKETRHIRGHTSEISQAVFSPDSKRLALADGGRVRVCEVATGDDCFTFPGHEREIRIVAFSPDGKTLVTGSYNEKVIYLWDARTGAVKRRLVGHRSGITGLAYSPDGKQVASSSDAGRIYLWDPRTGQHLHLLAELRNIVYGVIFSPDGKTLASMEKGSPAIRIWDVATGRQLRALERVTSSVIRAAFSPDGKVLAEVNSRGEGVGLWDVATGTRVRQFTAPHTYYLAFAPDGCSLAAGEDDGTVHLWDVATGREIRRFENRDQHGRPNSRGFAIAFAPDGLSLAVGYEDRTIRLWEVASGRERRRFNGHRGDVLALAFAPNGRRLASGSDDQTAMIWDVTADLGKSVILSHSDLERLWRDLGDVDAAKAYRAMCVLMMAPSQAVPWLRDRLHPVARPDADLRRRIASWVVDLDGEEFPVRKRAQQELEKLGDIAEPELRNTLQGKSSVEARRRIQDLVAKLEKKTPDKLQALRSLEVLEHIGTEESKRFLSSLAGGAENARLTRAAAAALQCSRRYSGMD